jgi:cytochrome b561
MTVRSRNAYTTLSITLHWIGAAAVVALFLTHEGERGGAAQAFHIGGGAILGLLLLWRSFRRVMLGFAAKPRQPEILNLVSRLVLWGLLASMIVVTITGYLLPWSRGAALDVYGLAIPSPLPSMHWLHEVCEVLHDVSGHAVMALAILHVLGAVKHAFFDDDRAVVSRMAVPARDGL